MSYRNFSDYQATPVSNTERSDNRDNPALHAMPFFAVPSTAFRISLELVSRVLEFGVSPRGLALAFFALATLLTTSTWLRPPLSPDISSLRIPLGILPAPSAHILLDSTSSVPLDSAGGMILAIIAIGGLTALFCPNRTGIAAGVLLMAAITANTAAALQHPEFIELLNEELSQRSHIITGMIGFYEHSLSFSSNGRVHIVRPFSRTMPIIEAWPYLAYGNLLVLLSIIGLYYSTPGRISRRFRVLGIWTFAGIMLSTVLCTPRITGEYNLYRAESLLDDGRLDKAREYLVEAVAVKPELGRLNRTWLLRGRLDYEQAIDSTASRYFQASRYAASSHTQLSDFLTQDVVNEAGDSPAIQVALAQIWVGEGMKELARSNFAGAEVHFREALLIQPNRLDCRFCIGIARAQMDLHNPEHAEAEMASFIQRCADPQLNADALNIVGDAYFANGDRLESREKYRKSWKVFNTLQNINIRAQKGLGGL